MQTKNSVDETQVDKIFESNPVPGFKNTTDMPILEKLVVLFLKEENFYQIAANQMPILWKLKKAF